MTSTSATVPTAGRFRSTLASPLPGVSPDAWARFVMAMDVQPIQAVSKSGGFGSYDLRPRRLVEMGVGCNLRSERTTSDGGRVYACDFIPPLTRERFLANPVTQYQALSRSMVLYFRALTSGEIRRPDGVSLAGALAILHIGGKGALGTWPDLFDHTRALYEKARGAF
jgi:hypothetical protein